MKPIALYEASAEVDAIHTKVAAAFGGWHYARSTEPRQTAHALICGQSERVIREHVKMLQRMNGDTFIVGEESEESFKFLSVLQAMSATLVKDLVVLVKGPGRNAAATACRVPSIKHLTITGCKVNSEMIDRVFVMIKQLPRAVPSGTVAEEWRERGPSPLRDLVKKSELHHNLARVFTEMHLCDTVRADAGKRYHHSLPVKAGQLALRNALHDLLMCAWR